MADPPAAHAARPEPDRGIGGSADFQSAQNAGWPHYSIVAADATLQALFGGLIPLAIDSGRRAQGKSLPGIVIS